MSRFLPLAALAITFAIAGCTTSQTTRMGVDEAMLSGQPEAAVAALAQQEKKLPERDRLIFNLKKGQLLALQKDYENSNAAFFAARRLIEQLDQKAEISVAGSAGELLATPNLMAYRPRIADRMYLHYYPALNFLRMGDLSAFRVEMRAAQDAHDRIANRFRKQIQKQQELLSKGREDARQQQEQMLAQQGTSSSMNQEDFENTLLGNPQLANLYSGLDSFDPGRLAESRFQSAAIHFLEGLSYALTATQPGGDDFQRARKSLEFAESAAPANKVIQQTRQWFKQHRHELANQRKVWIIHENALGPVIEEFRVALAFQVPYDQREYHRMNIDSMNPDLVIPVPTENPLFSKALFSFPVMKPRDPNLFYPHISVKVGSTQLRPDIISSPQEHQFIDFKGKLAVEQSSALIGGIVKAIIAEAINKEAEGNPLLGLLTSAASGALTHADTRIWNTLPREFQATATAIPESGKITLAADSGYLAAQPLSVTLPQSGSAILYVSTPGKYAPPTVSVIAFSRANGQAVVHSYDASPVPQMELKDTTASAN